MILWTIDKRNPVIAPGVLHPRFDEARAGAPHIVTLGDELRMVYWGSDRDGRNYILQAQSPLSEPNRWHPVADALIGPQPDTTHNDHGPGFPFLLPVTDTRWHLYFTAWGTRADGKLPNTTGLAVSDDRGETWHYHAEHPVIPLDRHYDAEGTGSVWVLRENNRFRMYYTAIGRYFAKPEGVETGHGDTIPEIGIAYAESEDGIHWNKPMDQLLIAPRGFDVTPYEYICSKPCVVRTQRGYVMWVNTFGTAYRVHRLTSADGLHWHWAKRLGPDGELGAGAVGSFDDHQRSYPTVVSFNGNLHCWFTGNRFGQTGVGYAVAPAPVEDEPEPADKARMAITIQRVTSSDRTLLDELFAVKFAEDGTNHDPEALAKWAQWIDAYFSDSNCVPLVIRREDEIVGFAIAELNRKPAGPDGRTPVGAHFIEEFFVIPQHRRQGIGMRAADIIFRDYPGRWMATTWPGGSSVDFWRHVATGRPAVSGREYGPDEHRGFPGQYVWVIEPLTGECAEPSGGADADKPCA